MNGAAARIAAPLEARDEPAETLVGPGAAILFSMGCPGLEAANEDTAAVLRIDAIPDREYQAEVADISLLARVDFSSGWPPAKNFDLKLAVTDADPRLKPGMSAVARIAVGRIPDQILVPPAAIFTSEGQTVVYKRTPRAFEEVPVEIVRRARDQVAVKGALTAGDRVSTTRPGDEKKDGAKK